MWDVGHGHDGPGPRRQAVRMRRKPLVATVLVTAVVGTVLAVLAPSAVADSGSESNSSPGNRGWSSSHGGGDSDDDD